MAQILRPKQPFIDPQFVQAILTGQIPPQMASGTPPQVGALPQGLPPQMPPQPPQMPPQLGQGPPGAPMLPQGSDGRSTPLGGMLGGKVGNFLDSDAALAWAAGALGGGSTGQAMGRGLGYALEARTTERKTKAEMETAQRQAEATSMFFERLGRTDLAELARNGSAKEAFQILEAEKRADASGAGGAASAAERGTSVVYYRDPATGEMVGGTVGKDGSFMPLDVPGELVNPIEMAGGKAGSVYDERAAAKARELLPGATSAVAIARDAIDALRNDIGGMSEQFGNVLGVPQQMLPVLPGTKRANFLVQLEQASGQAFMQARQMLKGGGQITDYEGRRGEAAYSRMQVAAEKGDQQAFLSALDDFEQAVEEGLQKLQAVAEGGYSEGGYALPSNAPTDTGGYTIEEVR